MATTPEVIQKRFGIEAELGDKEVPRGLFAFKGVASGDRKRLVSAYLPMLMSGAVAAEGQSTWSVKQVKQDAMGRRAGVSRATMNRRISRLALADERYDTPQKRRQHAEQLHGRAESRANEHRSTCEACLQSPPCEEGDRLRKRAAQAKDAEVYARRIESQRPVPVIWRQRQFAQPNTYGMNLPKRSEDFAVVEMETGTIISTSLTHRAAMEDCNRLNDEAAQRAIGGKTVYSYQVQAIGTSDGKYYFPTLQQLLAGNTREWWDAEFKAHGFKGVPRWIWDERLLDPETGKPLGTSARVVMTVYVLMGLLEEIRYEGGKRKPKGFLQISQPKVAAYAGMDVSTVYRANCKWEALGILRIVTDEREEITPGKYVSTPMKVIYLPFRMLTDQEAEIESARLERKVREIVAREGAQRIMQLREALRVGRELLDAWRGREHCMMAFWREYHRRLSAAFIYPDLIGQLVPIPPGEHPPS